MHEDYLAHQGRWMGYDEYLFGQFMQFKLKESGSYVKYKSKFLDFDDIMVEEEKKYLGGQKRAYGGKITFHLYGTAFKDFLQHANKQGVACCLREVFEPSSQSWLQLIMYPHGVFSLAFMYAILIFSMWKIRERSVFAKSRIRTAIIVQTGRCPVYSFACHSTLFR